MPIYLKIMACILLAINSVYASECLVKEEFFQYKCNGSVKVKNITELNSYLSNYGIRKKFY